MKAKKEIEFNCNYYGNHRAYCQALLWIQKMGFPAMAGEFAKIPPEKTGARVEVENNRQVTLAPECDLSGEPIRWRCSIDPVLEAF